MQFGLLTLVALIVTSAQALCNDSGPEWGLELEQVVDNLGAVCNELVGDFDHNVSKTTCRKSGDPARLLGFRITRTGIQTRRMRHADCIWHLANEIYGCSRGGKTTTVGWYIM